ncbi:glycoside hydrolase superfamily [Endogone sp. FLAS-F59071]|nr:glycoside hydrolase superfamily [Endogone sp. FLAS-F59071]|eukprot:RUS18372.1 glycoside hydrolase superfamily [Endogone sp. FLAS-F59071]
MTADLPAAAPSNGDVVSDIRHCQASGVRIFISIGGYTANVPITDNATGEAYADGLWNGYFGGSNSAYYRPFGSNVILDGVDLDLEQSTTSGYGAFVNKLKTYFDNSGRKYWISGAPQCGIPDPDMDTLLKTVWFDYVNPQFYNNWCYFTGTNFNYATVNPQYGLSWVAYAPNFVNPNTKLLLGVPAPGGGNGGNYDVLPNVQSVVPQLAQNYSNLFGGVMFWDCFWAGEATGGNWAQSVRAVIDQACGGKCITIQPPPYPSATTTITGVLLTTSTTTSTKTSTTTPKTSSSKTSTTTSSTSITASRISTTTSKTFTTGTSTTSSSGSVLPSDPCSSSGQMVCTSPNNSQSYAECVNGQWSVYNCGTGTVCQSNGSNIYCGFKQKRRLRLRRGLRA